MCVCVRRACKSVNKHVGISACTQAHVCTYRSVWLEMLLLKGQMNKVVTLFFLSIAHAHVRACAGQRYIAHIAIPIPRKDFEPTISESLLCIDSSVAFFISSCTSEGDGATLPRPKIPAIFPIVDDRFRRPYEIHSLQELRQIARQHFRLPQGVRR